MLLLFGRLMSETLYLWELGFKGREFRDWGFREFWLTCYSRHPEAAKPLTTVHVLHRPTGKAVSKIFRHT